MQIIWNPARIYGIQSRQLWEMINILDSCAVSDALPGYSIKLVFFSRTATPKQYSGSAHIHSLLDPILFWVLYKRHLTLKSFLCVCGLISFCPTVDLKSQKIIILLNPRSVMPHNTAWPFSHISHLSNMEKYSTSVTQNISMPEIAMNNITKQRN